MSTESALTPESLLPTTAETSSLTTIEQAELSQVAELISKVKGMYKATSLGMVMIGFSLRSIKETYFPSTNRGGRPNAALNRTGFSSFAELCSKKFDLENFETPARWIKMAESVEAKMHLTGDDLATTFAKLPWDWTHEEQLKIESAISAITEGKTQKEILSWQTSALIDLGLAGYASAKDKHGTNNPKGKNGTATPVKAPTQEEHTEAQIALARDFYFGVTAEGKCSPDSLIGRMLAELDSSPPFYSHLPQEDKKYIASRVLEPLLKNFQH